MSLTLQINYTQFYRCSSDTTDKTKKCSSSNPQEGREKKQEWKTKNEKQSEQKTNNKVVGLALTYKKLH